jgi:anti-sigma factor RsiW
MRDLKRLSCRRRVALLCDYLDGELSPAARRLVAAHRRSCLPCAEVLASLERTVGALKRLKAGRVPESSRRSLARALRAIR